ncbi:MAG: DEAD/DEAH box helicase family protein, partial [Bacilli bacterium]
MSNINTDILDGLIIGRVDPQIYAFSTHTIPNYLKIGDTYRPIEIRLDEWRKYFPNLVKKFSDVAKVDEEIFFRDHAIHSFLESSGKTRLQKGDIDEFLYFSNEFFKDTEVKDVKEAIDDIKKSHLCNDGRYQFYRFEDSRIPVSFTWKREENYKPRPNQQNAIDKFNEAIQKKHTNLLMYAVMRFGKSFTSMCCATEMDAQLVVIVSAKADVKAEWKKTVESHIRFEGYKFLDSNSLQNNRTIITDTLKENRVALFLTLQDLQGDEIKTKHKDLFNNNIDLLLIDETHFGVRGEEYGKVLNDIGITNNDERKKELEQIDDDLVKLDETIKILKSRIRIHLSGTPYRILMGSEFTKDNIISFCQFTDIVDEQEKWNDENLNKDDVKEWDNPYYGFPQMVRFAFNPNESSIKKMEELKKNGITYAFSALFKPQSISKDSKLHKHQKFEHEQEILDLLKVI